jgi:murein DD-endopeptidase MepM/ murein hydrolase activator NlpD
VRIGQQVAAGEQIGLIGTSGNSTTPHLHFQTLSTPTFFPADSLPWVFDRFELLGRVPERIWDDDLGRRPTGELPFTPAQPAGGRQGELPLDRTVVRLGGR